MVGKGKGSGRAGRGRWWVDLGVRWAGGRGAAGVGVGGKGGASGRRGRACAGGLDLIKSREAKGERP